MLASEDSDQGFSKEGPVLPETVLAGTAADDLWNMMSMLLTTFQDPYQKGICAISKAELNRNELVHGPITAKGVFSF
jgi:hypothetical protein